MSTLPWSYVVRLMSAIAELADEQNLGIAVVVADRHGAQVGALRMPGVPPLMGKMAYAKAYTSAQFRRDSNVLAELQDEKPLLLAAAGQLADHPLITAPGGLVIRLGEEVVGSLGISGATSEQDVEIGKAALARVPLEGDTPS